MPRASQKLSPTQSVLAMLAWMPKSRRPGIHVTRERRIISVMSFPATYSVRENGRQK